MDTLETRYAHWRTQYTDPILAAIATVIEALKTSPRAGSSYSVKQAAERLNLSSKKVYLMCLEGTLRCYRAGRAIRIPQSEIERLEGAFK